MKPLRTNGKDERKIGSKIQMKKELFLVSENHLSGSHQREAAIREKRSEN